MNNNLVPIYITNDGRIYNGRYCLPDDRMHNVERLFVLSTMEERCVGLIDLGYLPLVQRWVVWEG